MPAKAIYLDHAATTPADPEVVAAMLPWFSEQYGNPSTVYSLGLSASQALENARSSVAEILGAQPEEIVFTSGGTESDNWALVGAVAATKVAKSHLIVSSIEHHAVLSMAEHLEKQGTAALTILPVDSAGLVDPEEVRRAIRPETALVSIMHVNNEVGTIQPIAGIARVTREAGVLFHTDAVQSAGKLPVNVKDLGVDLLSLSAHKFYGPKGVGLLYIRKGARIGRLLHGGGQERNRRAGTHNVPGIVGLAKALELATSGMAEEERRERALRDRLWAGLEAVIPCIQINGNLEHRIASNLSFRLEGIEGEAMILMLDDKDICVSSGSACTTGSLDPSHVLLAMGIPAESAHGSLRITVGRHTTVEDIDYFLEVFPPIVSRLREMSPVWCDRCTLSPEPGCTIRS
jgi:cysteine desulfurase